MDVEQEALTLGWTPKEQFKGDPAKWIDAETYVSRGKEILPILKKDREKLTAVVDNLSTEVVTLKQALANANEAMETFREFHNTTAKREYEKARQELLSQKAEALRDGEFTTAVTIDEKLKDLNTAAPKELKAPAPAPAPSPAEAPEYRKWAEDNKEWLGTDKAKTAYATSIATYLRNMEPGLVGREFLDRVTEEVNAKFNSKPAEPPAPEPKNKVAGGSRGTSKSGKSFNDLPTEAREACDRMGSRLIGPNRAFKTQAEWRQQYVSDYDWS